jgi:hypothetical protein
MGNSYVEQEDHIKFLKGPRPPHLPNGEGDDDDDDVH